jgi:hypothetical protein
MKLIACLSAAFVFLLADVTSASGAERFAEPNGNGPVATCPLANPCNLSDAIEDIVVANGDVVTVLPGSYEVQTDDLIVDNGITVRGEDGQPRPLIPFQQRGFQVTNPSAVVRHLEINHSHSLGGTALSIFGGVAERMVVKSTTGEACGPYFAALLRDSVCWSTASGKAGVGTIVGGAASDAPTLRNVTAIGSGGQTASGILVEAFNGADLTMNAKNVIASGGVPGSGGGDVEAVTDSAASTSATITLDNSNYDAEREAGNAAAATNPGTLDNQTAPPAFVDAAAGDFHQTAASPTIDAGVTDGSTGSNDLDGDARGIDGDCDETAQPDIGADERAKCLPPNDDFADAVVLSGSVASVSGTNGNATEELGEPFYATEDVDSSNPTVTRSVWFRWTSPGNGPATVDLCTANDYDTMLAVFTGGALGSLTLVGANNNSVDCPPGSFASKVSFSATQGTTYQILVDGCCGLPRGNFTLDLVGPEAPPPQDDGGGGDTSPPDTTITKGPKDKTKKKQATFEFTSTEPGSSFQCAVDGQALKVPCTSPYTVKVKKGKHTFQVRATDQAGNVDGTPATDAWKLKKKKR